MINSRYMPFIVLEGLDGAGKTTQMRKLGEYLDDRGVKHHFQHFPRYDAPIYGEMIGRFLRGEFGSQDEVDPYIVALLFAGDRAQISHKMREWTDGGRFLIADRFVYSNIAFQCAKLPAGEARDRLREWILDLEFNHNNLPRPDLSLFLDVPFSFTRESLSLERKGDDRSYLEGAKDIHEQSLELQEVVREIYIDCAKEDERLVIIGCSNSKGEIDSPENIFSKIKEQIEQRLFNPKP